MFFAKPAFFLLLFSGTVFASSSDDRVWITRSDGTLQCDDATGAGAHDVIAGAKAQLTKKGVHIIESKKRNDGKLRAQMCGMSTGNETSFLIPKKELAKAKALGFEAVP